MRCGGQQCFHASFVLGSMATGVAFLVLGAIWNSPEAYGICMGLSVGSAAVACCTQRVQSHNEPANMWRAKEAEDADMRV